MNTEELKDIERSQNYHKLFEQSRISQANFEFKVACCRFCKDIGYIFSGRNKKQLDICDHKKELLWDRMKEKQNLEQILVKYQQSYEKKKRNMYKIDNPRKLKGKEEELKYMKELLDYGEKRLDLLFEDVKKLLEEIIGYKENDLKVLEEEVEQYLKKKEALKNSKSKSEITPVNVASGTDDKKKPVKYKSNESTNSEAKKSVKFNAESKTKVKNTPTKQNVAKPH